MPVSLPPSLPLSLSVCVCVCGLSKCRSLLLCHAARPVLPTKKRPALLLHAQFNSKSERESESAHEGEGEVGGLKICLLNQSIFISAGTRHLIKCKIAFFMARAAWPHPMRAQRVGGWVGCGSRCPAGAAARLAAKGSRSLASVDYPKRIWLCEPGGW